MYTFNQTNAPNTKDAASSEFNRLKFILTVTCSVLYLTPSASHDLPQIVLEQNEIVPNGIKHRPTESQPKHHAKQLREQSERPPSFRPLQSAQCFRSLVDIFSVFLFLLFHVLFFSCGVAPLQRLCSPARHHHHR